MTTIYIVTRGEYSDYGISAVFTDKALAQAYIDLYGGGEGGYTDYEIEEWEADRFAQEIREGNAIYRVSMWKDGSVNYCDVNSYVAPGETHIQHQRWGRNDGELMQTVVIAKDKNHAIKVANERRTRLIAEDRWAIGPIELHPAPPEQQS